MAVNTDDRDDLPDLADHEDGDLVGATRVLRPLIVADAEHNEAQGRLTDDVVAALGEAGLFGMWVPQELGGAELAPLHSLEVVEALSHADGSTGWVQMAASLSTGTGAAYLAPDVAHFLFDDSHAVIAGHGAPLGRAVVEPGGFRLTGSWSYASGVLHAQYVHTGAIVHDRDGPRIDPATGQPEYRIFVVPVDEVEVHDNWDSLGLRATGSIDYSITDVFVPSGYSHLQYQSTPNIGGELYRLGILGFAAIGHTGFALGAGRRLLEELNELACSQDGRPFNLAEQGGSESFQEQFARHDAALRAARAFAVEAWSAMEHHLVADEPLPTRAVTLVRLALNHATTMGSDIARFAFAYGGGRALRGGALQRYTRDMMTGAQHATVSPQILRECGVELLGLGEGKIWGMRGLIDPRGS
jgi:alkylation response protein AidB-like acyl-CoA dehydrogenase